MTPKRNTTTTRLIDQKPKLKKLVAQFTKAHQKFDDDLWRATYRHFHDAAKIGDLVVEMMREGGFKSYRQLHIWLELECGSSISQRSFYRYVNAAEDVKTVEVVHGKEMLTEVSSIKTLKMLANPRIPSEPHEGPKPALDEPPPKNWQGQSIRHPSTNGEVKDAQPEGGSGKKKATARAENNHPFEGENVPQRVDKNSLSWTLRERWAHQKAAPDCMPPQQSDEDFEEAHLCFQQAKNPGSTYATIARATGKDEAEVKRLLYGLDIDRVDALWAEFRRQTESPQTPELTFPENVIHPGCKDFKIDNDRTLSFTDLYGKRVQVMTEKAHIGTLLVKAVSSYQGKQGKEQGKQGKAQGKQGKGGSRAPNSR